MPHYNHKGLNTKHIEVAENHVLLYLLPVKSDFLFCMSFAVVGGWAGSGG